MHRLTLCGVLALLAGGFSDAQAELRPPMVAGGTAIVTNPDLGMYVVTVTSGTNVTVTLTFDGEDTLLGDVVEEVRIKPLNQSGAKVSVTVQGEFFAPDPDVPGVTLYVLRQIKNVVRDDFGAGEVWITKVQANLIGDVDRNYGVPQNLNTSYGETSGLIKANRINLVLANWSVLADIEAIGTSLSNPGGVVINQVRAALDEDSHPQYALDGSILGKIISNGGDIGTIRAANFISAVNNTASNNTRVIDTTAGTSSASKPARSATS